jgi:hypothetical protein
MSIILSNTTLVVAFGLLSAGVAIALQDLVSIFLFDHARLSCSLSPDRSLDEKAKIGTNSYQTPEKSRWKK